MNYRKYFVLILTILSILFASCSNFFEDSISKIEEGSASSESTKAGGESVKYVNVTGSINLEGAVPSAIRTAFPANPNISSLTLTVRAVNTTDSSDTVTGEIVSGSNNTSYRIGIPAGSTAKTYEIQINAANSLGTVLSGKSQAFTISQASPTTEQNVILRAIQTEGTGTFSLRVGISTGLGIQSAKVTYNPDLEHISSIATAKASNICTFAQGTINGTSITNGLACGSYLMTFEFYSGALDANHHVTGDLLYSFKQTVNIFKGLETNSWVKNGAEPYLTVSETSTQCIITATLIDEFTLTEIFVDSSLQNTDSTAAGYTSESGTFLNPCRTLSAAISKLNHADKDYKIYINGTLTGPQEIPDTLTDNTSEGSYHAKSVTIIGYNGLDDNGVPQDSLNGGFTSLNSYGVTLKVNSTVPVIIKNLMITGGNHDGDGGGIYSIGKLTLDSGAFVCGNITDTCGGGVMNNGGELTIKSGAVIANNTSSGTNNNAYGGGGVYNYNGNLVISGGQIKANTASQCGGGIYNAGLLSLCGNAYIPYGVDGVVGAGKNDFYLISGKKINITGKLTPPAECTDGIIAAITMSSYNGGDTLIEVATDASPATNVADESVRFKLTESGWKLFDNGKIGQQVFYIAAENSDDDYIGSDAKPLATFARLISKIKTQSTALNRRIVCEIIVKGDVESPNANFDFESTVADSILLRGYNDSPTVINNEGTIEGITAKMNGKGSNTVLKIDTDVPVTIRNLLITGAGGEDHRGILMQKGTLVLDSGACISGNTCHVPNNGGWGGGIYQAGGVTTMKSGAYITKNWADGLGGGVALCGGTFNLNGGEISYNIQSLDADSGGGAGMYVSHGTNFYCNSGRITKNQLALRGGGSGVLRTFDYTNCTFASGNAADYIFDNIPGDRQYGSRGWE